MGRYNPGLSARLSAGASSGSVVRVALGIEDVAVDAEIGHGIVFVPWVLVFLELIRGSSLSFAFDGIASGD